MPAKNHLSQEQRERLLKHLKEQDNPYTREKILILLLMNDGKTYHLQVWFWDESGFSLRVIRRKTWRKKGNSKKVTGQRRRGRVNIMGGLRYHDKKRINFIIKQGNADVFYEQLKSFNHFLRQEWIEAGNKPEDFDNNSAKIVIILDNASYHKRKDILARIEAEMPNIILEFLPPYSPDYNLIELVWHSANI